MKILSKMLLYNSLNVLFLNFKLNFKLKKVCKVTLYLSLFYTFDNNVNDLKQPQLSSRLVNISVVQLHICESDQVYSNPTFKLKGLVEFS